MRGFYLILVLLLLSSSLCAIAQEEELILNYHSEITVQLDGSLNVTENIKVRSLGHDINRGIFRSFPVRYRDKYNNQITVGFKVLGVKKNGINEPYKVIRQGDFEVIRIGDEHTILEPGIYSYSISYETNRQIGFFKDFDELYWNAIGSEWSFKILEASARITLPPGGIMGQYAAYSGKSGNSDCDCIIEKESESALFVKVNDNLLPGEGLTIATSWQKGIITPPTQTDKTKTFFRDNAGIFYLAIGFILALVYYFYAWNRVGRDPHKGGIYPQFDPPNGLDAASMRYLYKMSFDTQTYVAAIVEMATKGWLKIIEEKKKKFNLEKTAANIETPNTGYLIVLQKLFPLGLQEISLEQKEHKKIGGAMRGLQQDLYARLHGAYFKNNYLWAIPGFLISVLSLLLAIKYTFPNLLEIEKTMLILGLVICFFLTILLGKIFDTLLEYQDKGHIKTSTLLVEGILLLIIVGLPAYVVYYFNLSPAFGFLFFFILLGIVNAIFIQLMNAPTVSGRKIMDEIEGFRMYLNAAEKPLLETYNPPGITPEIFEKLLPFAIALEVGEAWGKAFERKLESLGEDQNNRSYYRPIWYTGSAFTAGSMVGFSDNLNSSFGSALATSSSPPGGSSGSGGGGSAGGGGGGGGGGGW
ncbi:DUF2207 domain-containing protein [uncultured Cyclobacterium sp.]|uniref:DUF2207 domain-containing protein n=1 Tax=uncultured Cyclobacterium sp. TaxID=453820 RepID=UPI0030EE02AF|tara:strand:- start:11629 stop:13554 length:1926 start_codon:yes stop_codon:yes gene_type:complete